MIVTKRIVELTGYNGFGCFNLKFAPQEYTQEQLDKDMMALEEIGPLDDNAITTAFGDAPGAQSTYPALPKLYDFNTSQCLLIGPCSSMQCLTHQFLPRNMWIAHPIPES